MNDIFIYGLISLAGLAILGLGVKVFISFKGGSKATFKNIKAGGDVIGRDKK